MKDILFYIFCAVMIWAVVWPYMSLMNLSDLSHLKGIEDNIRKCANEIEQLNSEIHILRKELSKTGKEGGTNEPLA